MCLRSKKTIIFFDENLRHWDHSDEQKKAVHLVPVASSLVFVVKGGKSKDSAVDGVLTQTVLNPARARKASRSEDNDVYDDDESDASQESAEDENDPMYDDMLRELEVVEEEEEVDRDEESEDDTHLPDQLVECFHINTYTTRGGAADKGPS